ncbi:MAG: translation initiation factor IF-2 [Patescibacteria group bacterium]
MAKNENPKENLIPRPPIVAVMGHVDHGKTSLLDYIRKTNVAAKEAGAITQAIGAYEIVHNGKKITFIDTPGHEAFSKMRARGARAADIAVLVVAADEGVKPQTKDALSAILSSGTPYAVALSKIDRPNADVDRVKNELASAGVMLEGYGGNISWQGTSAKTGEGVNELLDLILLMAEMEKLAYDPKARPGGFVLEAKMDSRRGILVSAIVKNGVLKEGQGIATESAFGSVKALEDFLGKRAKEFAPSSPVLITGFENLPQTGEEFAAGDIDLIKLEPKTAFVKKKAGQPAEAEDGRPVIKLILKADVSGSLEALSEIIKNLPSEKAKIEIIGEEVGDVSESDAKLAAFSGAIVVGFKTRIAKAAQNIAQIHNVKILTSEIIYELLKAVDELVSSAGRKTVSGELEVLKVFGKKGGNRQIIGGRVLSGAIKNNSRLEAARGEEIIGAGRVINLQQDKKDANQVGEGKECGLLFDSEVLIKEGDRLIAD